MKSQSITKVVLIHAEKDMNVYTKLHELFHVICQDISLWTTNANIMVAIQEKSGDHHSLKNESSGHHEHLTKFHGISFSCWDILIWTKVVDQQTNISIPRATLEAWLKMKQNQWAYPKFLLSINIY